MGQAASSAKPPPKHFLARELWQSARVNRDGWSDTDVLDTVKHSHCPPLLQGVPPLLQLVRRIVSGRRCETPLQHQPVMYMQMQGDAPSLANVIEADVLSYMRATAQKLGVEFVGVLRFPADAASRPVFQQSNAFFAHRSGSEGLGVSIQEDLPHLSRYL